MLEQLKILNNKLIIRNQYLNTKLYKKHLVIKKLLDIPDCFNKLGIEKSYSLLRDLGIEEDKLKYVYLDLID